MKIYDVIGIGVIVLEIAACLLANRKLKGRLQEIDGLQGLVSGRSKEKIIGRI